MDQTFRMPEIIFLTLPLIGLAGALARVGLHGSEAHAILKGTPQDNASKSQVSGSDTEKAAVMTIEGLVCDLACSSGTKRLRRQRPAMCQAEFSDHRDQGGVLYLPISESMPDWRQRQRLMPFLGKYVQVWGQVFERNGTRTITTPVIKELKDNYLQTDLQ